MRRVAIVGVVALAQWISLRASVTPRIPMWVAQTVHAEIPAGSTVYVYA